MKANTASALLTAVQPFNPERDNRMKKFRLTMEANDAFLLEMIGRHVVGLIEQKDNKEVQDALELLGLVPKKDQLQTQEQIDSFGEQLKSFKRSLEEFKNGDIIDGDK